MGIYVATERTQVANVFMEPGDKIQLTDEWEKELLLGKYRRAPKGNEKPGHDGKVGHSWLREVSKERLSKNDPNAPDGFVYLPIERNSQTKEYKDAGIPSVNRNGSRY